MADIQVYFNRPDRQFDRQRLLSDICGAQKGIAIASAWFTDTDLAEAILASSAGLILAIFSRTDLKRERGCEVYRMLSAVARTDKRLAVRVLGGDDWREGTMHHKMIAIDRLLVWCGSWNYTFQARSNWEGLWRIEDTAHNLAVWTEMIQIAGVRIIQEANGKQRWDTAAESSQGPIAVWEEEEDEGEFSCYDCGKVQPLCRMVITNGYGYGQCQDCESKERSTTPFWLHPDGIHIGQLIDAEIETDQDGRAIICWTWETEVPTEGNRLPRLDHRTGTDFGEKTSLTSFFRQMGWTLPKTQSEAASLIPDRFIGHRAYLTIVHELHRDGTRRADIKGFAPRAGHSGGIDPFDKP